MAKLQKKAKFVDNVVNDSGNVTISMKTTKYIIGILIFCTLSILGVAWNFKSSLENKIENTETTIINRINKLESGKVEPNKEKLYKHDTYIGILYERTNSKDDRVNNNASRPNMTSAPPLNIGDALPNTNRPPTE